MYVSRKAVIAVIASLIMLVVIGGVLSTRSKEGQVSRGSVQAIEQIPPVKAPDVVVADAKVVPASSAALSLSTGGIVTDVLVREGERVEAGQVLLRLDAEAQKAAVEQAKAALQRAEAQLAQMKAGARPQEIEAAKALVDVAQAHLTRAQVTGPQLEAAIAEAEVRRTTAQLQLLMAEERPQTVAMGEAEVAAARAALLQAEVALRATELRASFAGVVASMAPSPGEFVAPGTPVVWLADDSSWKFETEDLTELAVVRVAEGSGAMVTVDALPGVTFHGRVVSIKPMGENRLGDITYKAVIVSDQEDARLRWNMTASVTIAE